MTESQPLVSFALLAYNQERYIAEAVTSALSQDYSPLEVILSDDCSTDETFEIMSSLAKDYEGPHKVVINRNQRNLGIGSHVNSIFALSRGKLVVMAAGDDISCQTRTSSLVSAWTDDGFRADCVFSDCYEIDESGRVMGIRHLGTEARKSRPEAAKDGALVLGAVASWSRRLWETWGALDSDVVSEDSVFTLRAILSGGLLHVDSPLVRYRVGESSWILTPSNIKQVRMKGARLAEVILRNAEISARICKEFGDKGLQDLSQINLERATFYHSLYISDHHFLKALHLSLTKRNIDARLFMRHAIYRYFPAIVLMKKRLFP